MTFLTTLVVLVGTALISKIIARLTNSVDVLWYIVMGMIVTHTVIPLDATLLEEWSTLGVVFIMFYAGWRENLPVFVRAIWHNKWISLIGAIGPFFGALAAFTFLHFSWNEAVVAGFVFTATAVPYSIALLTTLGLRHTRAAQSVLAAAMADSFITIFLSVGLLPTFALLQVGGEHLTSVTAIILEALRHLSLVIGAFTIFGILGFIILPDTREHLARNLGGSNALPSPHMCHGIVCRGNHIIAALRRLPGMRTINEIFLNVRIAVPLTLFLLFLLALLAHHMGLHPAIGAYLTGLILHAEMYHEIDEDGDGVADDIVPTTFKNLSVFFFFAQEWIGPFFFIYLGNQVVVPWAHVNNLVIGALIAAACVGIMQFLTAAIAARMTARLPLHDAILLGFGMWPRDVLAFVVLGIAASVGLVSTDGPFVTMVIMTVLILNISASLAMRVWKPYYLAQEDTYTALQPPRA